MTMKNILPVANHRGGQAAVEAGRQRGGAPRNPCSERAPRPACRQRTRRNVRTPTPARHHPLPPRQPLPHTTGGTTHSSYHMPPSIIQ